VNRNFGPSRRGARIDTSADETTSPATHARRRVAVLVAGTVVAAGVWLIPSSSTPVQAASAKITICHRTHSTTNPYRKITVNQNAVQNGGHGGHGLPNGSQNPAVYDSTFSYASNNKYWGDIIPGGDAQGLPYNGTTQIALNWTTLGKADYFGALCVGMSPTQFYDAEIAAGQTSASVITDLNDQDANEDIALLAAIGGSFTAGNISSWSSAVTVTTLAATGVAQTNATLNGTLTVGTTSTATSFQWGTSPTLATFTTTAATPSPVTNTTAVSAALSGLTAGTTYYFRAVGTTNAGLDTEGVLYGAILSFQTDAAATTTTAAATTTTAAATTTTAAATTTTAAATTTTEAATTTTEAATTTTAAATTTTEAATTTTEAATTTTEAATTTTEAATTTTEEPTTTTAAATTTTEAATTTTEEPTTTTAAATTTTEAATTTTEAATTTTEAATTTTEAATTTTEAATTTTEAATTTSTGATTTTAALTTTTAAATTTEPATTDPATTEPATTEPATTLEPTTSVAGEVAGVHGIVWFDRNHDGVFNGTEWVLPGVTVNLSSSHTAPTSSLRTAAAATVRSAVTAVDGSYQFNGLVPGQYTVTATAAIKGFDYTSDTDGALDWVVSVQAIANTSAVADFAGLGRGEVLGQVFDSATLEGLPFAAITCHWSGFDDVTGTGDDVTFQVTADSTGSFDMAGVPYGYFTCDGLDSSTGRASAPAAAAVFSPDAVRAPLPIAPNAPPRVVAETPPGGLPETGTDSSTAVLYGCVLTLAGTAIVLAMRRRPRRAR